MNTFLLALDNYQRNRLSMLFLVAVFTISFLSIGVVIYYNQLNSTSIDICNDVFKKGLKGTGIIYCDDIDKMETFRHIEQELNEIPEIETVSGISDRFSFKLLNPTGKIEKDILSHQKDRKGIAIGGTAINYSGWDLCNIQLAVGTDPYASNLAEDEIALYLGNGFKGIEVGTIIPTQSDKKLKVCGILETNQKFIDTSVWTANNYQEEIYQDMEYGRIFVFPDSMTTAGYDMLTFFSVTDEKQMQNACNEVYKVYEKNNSKVTVGNLYDILARMSVYNMRKIRLAKVLSYFVMISIVIITTCTLISEIFMNRGEYGVFYANGMTYGQLSFVIILKNILVLVLSGILAFTLAFVVLQTGLLEGIDTEVLWKHTLIKAIVSELIVVCCGISVPLIYLKSLRPAELIGGNEWLN